MDKDLRAIQESRDRVAAASKAAFAMLDLDQRQTDSIVKAMAEAALANAEKLAQMAWSETGYGKVGDKLQKNMFAAKNVYQAIAPMQTVGIINRDRRLKTFDVAVPMGVIAAIIPSTNPTSTTIYKLLIAVKGRNAVVVSPHPAARTAISATVDIMAQAARQAGAPADIISVLSENSMAGTDALFTHPQTAMILATGGSAMVRAAYRSGRPAIGVGPGNVPAFIEKSADIPQAVADIVSGKAFDNGVICASEQSAVVEKSIDDKVRKEFTRNRAHFCSAEEKKRLQNFMIKADGSLHTAVVGKSPQWLAGQAGFNVAEDTSILVVELASVGKNDPLSCEKLSPVLGYYIVDNWESGCQRAIEILNYGGIGHTLAIHSRNDKIVEEFALHKPAFRIVVNSPATHGAIGLSTNLMPAMTLGPGAVGGSSSSDNISPLHLINIKHVAYGVRNVAALSPQSSTAGNNLASASSGDVKKRIENEVMALLKAEEKQTHDTEHADRAVNAVIERLRKG
jgi:acetaldehyde dehydrogenase (acetylating)